MLEIKPDIDLMHEAQLKMLALFIICGIAVLIVIGVKEIIKKIHKR